MIENCGFAGCALYPPGYVCYRARCVPLASLSAAQRDELQRRVIGGAYPPDFRHPRSLSGHCPPCHVEFAGGCEPCPPGAFFAECRGCDKPAKPVLATLAQVGVLGFLAVVVIGKLRKR